MARSRALREVRPRVSGAPSHPPLRVTAWMCLAVLAPVQLAWGAVAGQQRVWLTVATILLFWAATLSGALLYRGPVWTGRYLALTLIGGWLVEVFGLGTGLPFGDYHYTDALGPQLAGVPLLIPVAWSMMTYPCLVAGAGLARRLNLSPRLTLAATAGLGGLTLAAWDFFLDPQMVGERYWVWDSAPLPLPGIPGIPAQNYLGWLIVSVLLVAAVAALRVPESAPGPAWESVPSVQLAWMYVTNLVGAAFIFDRPGAAIWGGVCMGLVVLPWWWIRVRS